MTAGWMTVLVVGVATMTIKGAGPVLLGGRQLPNPVLEVVALLPAALLAALVGVLTLGAEDRLVLDARVAGVAVAIVLVWLRAPVLLVVIAAGAAAAIARAVGVP
jgi:branched-subunit amino acid transport protein